VREAEEAGGGRNCKSSLLLLTELHQRDYLFSFLLFFSFSTDGRRERVGSHE
jgi:hypothetical protein